MVRRRGILESEPHPGESCCELGRTTRYCLFWLYHTSRGLVQNGAQRGSGEVGLPEVVFLSNDTVAKEGPSGTMRATLVVTSGVARSSVLALLRTVARASPFGLWTKRR